MDFSEHVSVSAFAVEAKVGKTKEGGATKARVYRDKQFWPKFVYSDKHFAKSFVIIEKAQSMRILTVLGLKSLRILTPFIISR